MALKCNECGYDNVDDALMCNMCQKIFRKEKKPSDGASVSQPPAVTAKTAARGTPPAAETTSAPFGTAPAPRPKTIEGLDAMGWHERGLECLQNQQGDAALECYEKALAIEPRFTKAWGNKATLLHLSGRNEGALQAIEAALRIDPLYMTCWYTKAIIEYSSKQYPQAMRSFNEVLTFPLRSGPGNAAKRPSGDAGDARGRRAGRGTGCFGVGRRRNATFPAGAVARSSLLRQSDRAGLKIGSRLALQVLRPDEARSRLSRRPSPLLPMPPRPG